MTRRLVRYTGRSYDHSGQAYLWSVQASVPVHTVLPVCPAIGQLPPGRMTVGAGGAYLVVDQAAGGVTFAGLTISPDCVLGDVYNTDGDLLLEDGPERRSLLTTGVAAVTPAQAAAAAKFGWMLADAEPGTDLVRIQRF